jgi:type IV pilus assembly protein PilB
MSSSNKPLILCVDDEPPVCRLLSGIVREGGYEPLAVESGDAAIKALQRTKPDLILLDIMMPGMDGFEVCASLQEDDETSHIPVIFVTARGDQQDKARALALGGVDYVVKPFEREALLAKIRVQLDRLPCWKGLCKEAVTWSETVQPSDFLRFKEQLADHVNASPAVREKLVKVSPFRIYAACSELGIRHAQMAQLMARCLGLTYAPAINPEDLRLGVLQPSFCKTHLVVPVRETSAENAFALSNPFNWELLDLLRRFSGAAQAPALVITEPQNIEALFKRIGEGERAKPVVTETPVADKDQRARMLHGMREQLTEEEIEKLPVVEIADHILYKAVRQRASDIHIDPKETHSLIRFRIDGDLRNIFTLTATVGSRVISRFKAHAGMDIAQRRKPQDGAFAAVVEDKAYKFRMSTTSTPAGESVVIRILDADTKPKDLRELGMTEDQVQTLVSLANRKQGLILVVGETGSGKSTTLYSLFACLDTKTRSLITIEDPVEYTIPFANQQQVNEKAGLTFEAVLKSAMRQDPDILFLGEARDPASTKMLLDFASTGHLTITTMHTSNATSAVFRLERLGITRSAIAETVIGIVAQRLLRKLCPDCKEVAAISQKEAEMLAPFAQEPLTEVARPRGCPKCNNTGYRGREGIYEILRFDSEIADMVRAGAPISEIRQVLYRRGDYLISKHAVDKVRQLLCSPQDVFEDVLVEEVRLQPETAAAKSAKGASPGPGPANKQAVLIAEDDQDTQALLKLHLENGGYDVTVAGDGVDALLYLGKQPFDLILSDLNMPNLDGFKFMEMMTQKGIRTPVIFLTAQTEEEVEQKCLELGAADYIKKPVKKDILLMRVKKALESHSERETVHGCLP